MEQKSIQELAYELWVARGRPEGSSAEDWQEAERQLTLKSHKLTVQTHEVQVHEVDIDEGLMESFPASDPPASHIPDGPPDNAAAMWEESSTPRNTSTRTSAKPRSPRKRSTPRPDASK